MSNEEKNAEFKIGPRGERIYVDSKKGLEMKKAWETHGEEEAKKQTIPTPVQQQKTFYKRWPEGNRLICIEVHDNPGITAEKIANKLMEKSQEAQWRGAEKLIQKIYNLAFNGFIKAPEKNGKYTLTNNGKKLLEEEPQKIGEEKTAKTKERKSTLTQLDEQLKAKQEKHFEKKQVPVDSENALKHQIKECKARIDQVNVFTEKPEKKEKVHPPSRWDLEKQLDECHERRLRLLEKNEALKNLIKAALEVIRLKALED